MIKKNLQVAPTENPVVLCEGKFIRLVKHGWWEYAQRNNCCGIVIILAMTRDKKVILIEQYRIPVARNVIEFPAGLVGDINPKKKESILTSAKREFKEETGYQAGKMVRITEGPVSAGFSPDIVTILLARDIRKIARGGGDGTEFIKVHEVPFAKVDAWLDQKRKKGCLVDPKIYAGLYWLKKYNG